MRVLAPRSARARGKYKKVQHSLLKRKEMSLVGRGQYSQFPSSLAHESANQQVPGSPLSPFFFTAPPRGAAGQRSGVLCSPSSGSPLAQVPDGGSPLLRHLLAGRKRRRDEASPPSPSEHSRRHSPRVPNSIIVLRRTAAQPNPTKNTKGDQVVPSPSNPPREEKSGGKEEKDSTGESGSLRTLPEVTDNTKLLDLFGETAEIFASSREE